ncbi:unnamed protein product [Pleuronectes platessa]|uniref:Uncharacterized protein n=1 Tax=Pleuronectes platessa TaxID=8262 RepID=A0A9N7VPZ5_PLEPL|nr:unnamed protein product [Pleuronectes platessa]
MERVGQGQQQQQGRGEGITIQPLKKTTGSSAADLLLHRDSNLSSRPRLSADGPLACKELDLLLRVHVTTIMGHMVGCETKVQGGSLSQRGRLPKWPFFSLKASAKNVGKLHTLFTSQVCMCRSSSFLPKRRSALHANQANELAEYDLAHQQCEEEEHRSEMANVLS